MKEVIILQGLPASGKSTWAKEQVSKHPNYKRVNKDDLRSMLDNSTFSKENEKFVLKMRDTIIINSIVDGNSVIVDDTNFEEKHITHITNLVSSYKVSVRVKRFDIDVNEAIKRDSMRQKPVGRKVIMDMFEKYIQPKRISHQYREVQTNKPNCVIVDIDGTLAIKGDRSPFDWDKVDQDTVNVPVLKLLNMISYVDGGPKIIFMSGRDEVCCIKTIEWIKSVFKFDFALYMRKKGDMRKDSIVKRELFEKHIEPYYNVDFAVDDRDSIVSLYRNDLKIPCFQVEYGNF